MIVPLKVALVFLVPIVKMLPAESDTVPLPLPVREPTDRAESAFRGAVVRDVAGAEGAGVAGVHQAAGADESRTAIGVGEAETEPFPEPVTVTPPVPDTMPPTVALPRARLVDREGAVVGDRRAGSLKLDGGGAVAELEGAAVDRGRRAVSRRGVVEDRGACARRDQRQGLAAGAGRRDRASEGAAVDGEGRIVAGAVVDDGAGPVELPERQDVVVDIERCGASGGGCSDFR